MIKPYVIREVTIDLPEVLVKSLGVGAEVLAQYLTSLADAGVDDPKNHPPPPPVLCRICERQITPWWFEKHSELCMQEHSAELEVQLAQESLADQRGAIVKVLDGLEAMTTARNATSSDSSSSFSSISMTASTPAKAVPPEYKGFAIGPPSNPSSSPSSGRSSPASFSHLNSETPAFAPGHHRVRSFAIRRPLARIVELVLDLCDTAIEISMPDIKETGNQRLEELRTQSPQSENRICQVLQWQSPSTGTLEQEQGLAVLCDDTFGMAKAKVDAVLRHRRILEYSERIRVEFEILVQECIDAAIEKTSQIAAGEMSDSSEESAEQEQSQISLAPSISDDSQQRLSIDSSSTMAMALRNVSESSLLLAAGRRSSSTADSTRSSSPRGAQTPRSNAGAMSFISQSKRASMHCESDAGAESDSSVLSSSVFPPSRRTESPCDLGLTRMASSRERKRRSLILPSMSSNRQPSPARSAQPSSPLRMNKARPPSMCETLHSPIASPVLSTSDFSSPMVGAQQLHHHRRQSSNASSDVHRPAVSPRLMPVSNPQPRAVPPSIKDFEIIKPISKGAFGSVYLSKKKSTGDYFAIKVLKKADMVAKNQITNVKAERAIMMWQGESDFVAKLYWTFSSKEYLYLVMEYLNGGDCAALIKTLGGLPESWAKKYLAEVVLGVEHLHKRGIVHRDLKPDNLLIDQKGHLKLTDFGLSRMGLIGRQKRALKDKNDDPHPDLLKNGPFQRNVSVASSRSASFDFQGNTFSPSQTPGLTPTLAGEIGQPSYFSLNRESSLSREHSRRTSLHRGDSGDRDGAQPGYRRSSMMMLEDQFYQLKSPIEEEMYPAEERDSLDPNALQHAISQTSSVHNSNTPPQTSGMLPPRLALFDPEDTDRRFVGTPDYLAPETINGSGQDQVSDWWSIGCILFEFLYGYPPFHADTPDEVFENILSRKIDWPDEDDFDISPEARDLMEKLMCKDANTRLGANANEKFESGGEEIRSHPWFVDINWEKLRNDDASFVPAPADLEDTEYFDARGATLQSFEGEFEDQKSSPANTPGSTYADRPHDALSRVRNQANSAKRGLLPLHIPPHVREGRSRRLSEPVANDDFGEFSFKNLPILEKANKDVIQKLRAEAMQAHSKPTSTAASPSAASPSPSLESSPLLLAPLKRTLSSNKGQNRSASPSILGHPIASPNRISQPSSPLLVQFSTGQHHERRKTSSGSSVTGNMPPTSLPMGNVLDGPRGSANFKPPSLSSSSSSPIRTSKMSASMDLSQERGLHPHRLSGSIHGTTLSPRARAQTVGSQGPDSVTPVSLPKAEAREAPPYEYKRRSGIFDLSPSSSDNEDHRQKAILRVQRRRQHSRKLSEITAERGPQFRPLDVLICEDHPVSRMVMERLVEKLRCRSITAQDGSEAMRYALGSIKFDVILTEYKLPQVNGADLARMIRDTKNANSHTPIIAVTGYLKDLQAPHHFDALIEKPPNTQKLVDQMGRLCQWKPPAPDQPSNPLSPLPPLRPLLQPPLQLANLRQEYLKSGESPTSNSSGHVPALSSSYRGSSREDSISSGFFTDSDSRADDFISLSTTANKPCLDEWQERELSRTFGGLGILGDQIALNGGTGAVGNVQTGSNEKAVVPVLPSLHQQASAPPALEHQTPTRQRSSEQINLRQRQAEAHKRDLAESGDDEDDELGDVQVRTKSPKRSGVKPSKLGIEMMRTNSQGSVISVEERASNTLEAYPSRSSPPPVITEESIAEDLASMTLEEHQKQQQQQQRQRDNNDGGSFNHGHKSVTPPEKSVPPLMGSTESLRPADMDVTPKPTHAMDIDPDPTPRASSSPSGRT